MTKRTHQNYLKDSQGCFESNLPSAKGIPSVIESVENLEISGEYLRDLFKMKKGSVKYE